MFIKIKIQILKRKKKKAKSILKANNVTKMTKTKKKNYREVTKKMEKRTEVIQCFLHS